MPVRIYLDSCCYTRQTDDQTQPRIRMESEAVQVILSECAKGNFTLVSSVTVAFEICNIPDTYKRHFALSQFNSISEAIPYTDAIRQRAKEFERYNLKAFDSIHLATAEYADVEYLFTTDTRFINSAGKTNTNIKVVNPVSIMEVLQNES